MAFLSSLTSLSVGRTDLLTEKFEEGSENWNAGENDL